MKKFKFMALAMLASTFALASCDLSGVKSFVKKIPGAQTIYDKITGKTEENEEKEAKVLSVKINTDVSVITDETEPFKLSVKVEVSGDASKEVTWASSDSAVATVSEQGIVTPKSAGKFTVTVTSKADASKKDSKEIEVVAVPGVASVVIEGGDRDVILHTGDLELKAVVATKGSAAKGVIWESDDETVAEVSEFGLVSFKKAGKVNISATSKFDRTKSSSVELTVINHGLYPELVEEGLSFSETLPSEEISDFVGSEFTAEFETEEGFYFIEFPEEAPSEENPYGSPASFKLLFEAYYSYLYGFGDALEEVNFKSFDSASYYGAFFDPQKEYEVLVDLVEISEEDMLLGASFFMIDDVWYCTEKTDDTAWNEEVAAALADFDVELPFVALGDAYESELDDDILYISDYCYDYELLEGYGEVLEAAGFDKSGSDEAGYSYKKLLPDGITKEVVSFYFDVDFYGNTIEIKKVTEFDEFPTDAVEAFYAGKGITGLSVPTYEAADSEAYFSISISADFYEINIFGSTVAERDAYVQELDTADWYTGAGRYTGDYLAAKSGASMFVEDWLDYTDCIKVLCFVPEWPSADINEDFEELGITDSFPAFNGDAFRYVFYSGQVVVRVEEGTQEEQIAAYAQMLVQDEHFTLLSTDGYGRSTYLSPNQQFTIMPWDGTLAATSTNPAPARNIYINYAPYVTEFPTADVNKFLTDNTMGFTIPEGSEATLPGSSFDLTETTNQGFPILYVEIGGEYLSEYVSLLEPLVTAQGYVGGVDPDDPTYYSWQTSSYNTVVVYVDSGSTVLVFWGVNL